VRGALFLLALCAACGGASRGAGSRSSPGEVGTVHAPAPDALVGDYECRFARGDTELDPSACAIRDGGDGRLRLEQAGGALRLTGSVEPEDAGFRLTGEVACTGEPCPAAGTRDIVFFTQRTGAFSAVVPLPSGDLLNIDLTRR
jgi:hypothetical protein